MASSYNVDYWDGKSSVEISADMIKLRYANYPKDYFMGVLPNSQYGSVAVLPSFLPSVGGSNAVVARTTPYVEDSAASLVQNPASSTSLLTSYGNTTGKTRILSLNSDLSALSIRATEYLQRWKEVVQFSSKDYSDQMAAQFGIKIGRAHV